MNRRHTSAFSLIELMIVVAIIADLAVIALPSFTRARMQTQDTHFINDLRVATSAFEIYSVENDGYPPNANQGVVPAGMGGYLGEMPWTEPTPIGGRWDWEPSAGNPARLGVRFPSTGKDVRMSEIDAKVDNGILSTGAFRRVNSKLFLHIIE